MKIFIVTVPNREAREIEVSPESSILMLKNTIKLSFPELNQDDRVLLQDETKKLSLILEDDPVSIWFKAEPGDILRVTDDSSIRYRLVTSSKRPKVKGDRLPAPTDRHYSIAFKHVGIMMKIRRGVYDDEVDSEVDQMVREKAVGGLRNNKGKLMYVFVTDTRINTLGKAEFKSTMERFYSEALEDAKQKIMELNEFTMSFSDLCEQPRVSKENMLLNKYLEIIVVFDNQDNVVSKQKKLIRNVPFIQLIPVQNLVYNVMSHEYQPAFYLLDPNTEHDRKEIREILNLNSMVLKDEKTLSSYKIKEGAKLVFI